MKSIIGGARPEAAAVPTLDLNDLLIDHPAASYIFRCDGDILIVDRAAHPHRDSMVIVELKRGFVLEIYHGQDAWGVVTYQLHKSD